MLTIQFVPYHKIERLSSDGRIKKLLNLVKQDKIVVLEGRLRNEEEAELIKRTMEEINSRFKGIEIAVVYPEGSEGSIITKAKKEVVSLLLGDRQGLTVIGPATVVKEIKKDPNKIELFTQEKRHNGHKKRKGRR